MKIIHNRIAILTLTVVLAILSVLMGSDFASGYTWLLMAIQYLVYIYLYFNHIGDKIFLFSPLFLSIGYITISIILGNIYMSFGLMDTFFSTYGLQRWSTHHVATAYILLCNGVLAYLSLSVRSSAPSSVAWHGVPGSSADFVWIGLVCIGTSFIVRLFAGESNVLFLIATTTSIVGVSSLAWVVAIRRTLTGTLFLLAVILVSSLVFYDEKRILLTFVLLGLFCYAFNFSIASKLRAVVVTGGVVALVIVLVIVMSILRGYGEYGDTSLLSLPFLIIDYINQPLFWTFMGKNFEYSYMYFHTYNALDFVFQDPSEYMLFGSSIFKAVFVFLQFDFIVSPNSIIHEYTNAIDPLFRSMGGSYPVNIYVEMFWNFHWLGILAILLVFYAIDKFFYMMIRFLGIAPGNVGVIYLMSFYAITTFYVRGSGLDVFVLYAGFISAIIFLLSWKIPAFIPVGRRPSPFRRRTLAKP